MEDVIEEGDEEVKNLEGEEADEGEALRLNLDADEVETE